MSPPVLRPHSVAELARALQLLAHDKATLGRDAVLSREHFRAVGAIEPQSATVTVGAGVMLRDLEQRLWSDGLSLGPLPPSAFASDVAGFLEGTWAGLRSIPGGRLEPLCMSLEAVLAGGHLLRTHPSPRSASGPDLMALVLGGGGRLALVVSATLRCVPAPREHRSSAWAFAEAGPAITALRAALEDGALPAQVGLARADGRVLLSAKFQGSPDQVDRDLGSLARRARAERAAAATPAVGPGQVEEREASWAAVQRAVEQGSALVLHRLAIGSCVVAGAVEGVPLGHQVPAHALSATLDPSRVLSEGGL